MPDGIHFFGNNISEGALQDTTVSDKGCRAKRVPFKIFYIT